MSGNFEDANQYVCMDSSVPKDTTLWIGRVKFIDRSFVGTATSRAKRAAEQCFGSVHGSFACEFSRAKRPAEPTGQLSWAAQQSRAVSWAERPWGRPASGGRLTPPARAFGLSFCSYRKLTLWVTAEVIGLCTAQIFFFLPQLKKKKKFQLKTFKLKI